MSSLTWRPVVRRPNTLSSRLEPVTFGCFFWPHRVFTLSGMCRILVSLIVLGWTWSAAADSVLRVGLTAAPPSLGNPYQNQGTTSNFVWPTFYDTLTHRNNAGEIVPWLAESWEMVGPTTWHFHLRPNVFFSNGEPFNANAVKVTFDMLRTDAARGYSWQRDAAYYPRIEAIDDLTVAIHTDGPNLLAPNYLSGLYIAAPKHLSDVGYAGLREEPIGTGPFIVEQWETARITLTANRDSWHPPKVDRLDLLVVPDASARMQALETGDIHIAIAINTDQMDRVAMLGHRTHMRTPNRIMVLAFQSMDPRLPFHDERVRQAVNYAVNMELITEVLLAGLVKPASQPATPESVGYDPTLKPYPYDPYKARALLKDAGFENGFSFVNVSPGNTLPNDTAILQQIATDLAAVGIDMENRLVPYAQLLRAVVQGDFDGQSLMMDFNNRFGDVLRPVARNQNHGCNGFNPWFCDQDIHKVIEQAMTATDMDERVRLSQQVVRFYRDTAESLFLFPVVGLDAVSSRVTHWEPWNDNLMFDLVELEGD